ncbi:DUF4349 domain-containing protein [Massilia sp. CCM 8695]|uniref:DUF4349 domain-containing protein n=1 Tax=Massilia frigida TaxID=2609281 RepID=A0ABX0N293_9BURK|nr:DUF4349 domain-containing protein [Massilia frigida]NHZ79427.1 DUF4349 domain-containing protein [Massilia frigida]
MKCLFGVAVVLLLSACSQQLGKSVESTIPRQLSSKASSAALDTPAARRYIATRHTLLLEAPEAELQKQFDAIQAACVKLACVVLRADQTQAGPHRPAQATLTARLPPQAFDSFLNTMLEHGKLLQHQRENEDLTPEVIDVDAKIANLTALKTRILDLLAKRSGTLEDVLAADKQLSMIQAELDSIQGKRKALAGQTEMTRVDLTLVPQPLGAERSWAAPVAQAAGASGRVLMSSLATLITATVAVLPWLLVGLPLFLWLRKRYRLRKARRAQAAR